MGDHRKLEVWHRARRLVRRIRALIEALPPNVKRSDADQIIRATKPIRNNIAEGAGLNTDPLFARRLRDALGSANEVQDQLCNLDDEGFLRDCDRDLDQEVADIRSMLVGLMRVVSGDVPPKPERTKPPVRRRPTGVEAPRPPDPSKKPPANADGSSTPRG